MSYVSIVQLMILVLPANKQKEEHWLIINAFVKMGYLMIIVHPEILLASNVITHVKIVILEFNAFHAV